MTLFVFLLALSLGGGTLQGLWSDAIVQIAALPLIGLAVSRMCKAGLPRHTRWPLILTGVIVLLFCAQRLPLPPLLWMHLPGREPFIASFRAAGVAPPWESLTLDPEATWRSFFSLFPAVGLFWACVYLPAPIRRLMSAFILIFALLNVLLGLFQLSGGPDSPLRFYNPTNVTNPVGIFANSDHFAAFLYAAIPLAAAWGISILLSRGRRQSFALAMILLVYAVVLLGLGLAHSRTGILIGLASGFASPAIGWDFSRRRESAGKSERLKLGLALAGANLLGLLLAFQFGFVGLANRFQGQDLLRDLRWPIAHVTTRAIEANLPLGTGFGTFEAVYQMFETPAVVVQPYVNHAHDEWLEIALEGGIPALISVAAFLAWYAFASLRVWRSEGPKDPLDRALARAGSIVAASLLIHSSFDYPLRTTTLMVVFAFSCALMVDPIERGPQP